MEVIAIKLYTSNILYRQINKYLREGKYQEKWIVFLRIITDALKKMPYYEKKCYRGIKNHQNY